MKERQSIMSDRTRRDIIKANKRKVMDRANRDLKSNSKSSNKHNLPETESMRNNRASGEPCNYGNYGYTPDYMDPRTAEDDLDRDN